MGRDNAVEALLECYRAGAYEFGEDFLLKCYDVERQFQYDPDRDVPVEHLRRLVEAEVTRLLAADGHAEPRR